MRIQVIRHASSATEKEGITFSPLSAPRAIDDFDVNKIFDINLKGTYNCCRSVVPAMVSQKSGKIINETEIVFISFLLIAILC